jgi:UDP-N-acetylmuramate dehydrogenase
VEALDWASEHDIPFFVFGGGSNLLFDDEGFRGLVIHLKNGELNVDSENVSADAGIKMSKVVNAAQEAGLTGLEGWNGLPGTVGGAVYGNAGCFGVETKDVLESAELWMPGVGRKTVKNDFFEYDYRTSKLKREPAIVLSATFKLKKGDKEEIKKGMMETAVSRIKKQPPGLSTGSFFKNPVDHPAGWLIDQCGLKGHRHGNAGISEHHANFFMNKGGATAQEILELGDIATAAVKEKFGIELEREIIYIAPN